MSTAHFYIWKLSRCRDEQTEFVIQAEFASTWPLLLISGAEAELAILLTIELCSDTMMTAVAATLCTDYDNMSFGCSDGRKNVGVNMSHYIDLATPTRTSRRGLLKVARKMWKSTNMYAQKLSWKVSSRRLR